MIYILYNLLWNKKDEKEDGQKEGNMCVWCDWRERDGDIGKSFRNKRKHWDVV